MQQRDTCRGIPPDHRFLSDECRRADRHASAGPVALLILNKQITKELLLFSVPYATDVDVLSCELNFTNELLVPPNSLSTPKTWEYKSK